MTADQVRKQTVKNAIDVLNRINELDSTVLPQLIKYRVPCNEALADDPTVQVGKLMDGAWEVGLLGIINGFFGVDENEVGYIYAHLDGLGGILKFSDNEVGI